MRNPLPLPTLLRAVGLLLLAVASALGLNALREAPLPLAAYEPAASCELAQGTEPVVAGPVAIAAQCALSEDVLIVDTRSAEAFERGHVAGATHLPCSAPRLQADQLLALVGPRRSVVVYGDDTAGALAVARSLASHAPTLETFVIDGGFAAWESAALACASGPCEVCNEETSHAH